MPRKKKTTVETPVTPKADPSPFNKSAFIREHSTKSPQDIVELAGKQGHELKIGLVYAVRAEAKKKAGKTPGKASKTKTPAIDPEVMTVHPKAQGTLKGTLQSLCMAFGFTSVKTALDQIDVDISRVKLGL